MVDVGNLHIPLGPWFMGVLNNRGMGFLLSPIRDDANGRGKLPGGALHVSVGHPIPQKTSKNQGRQPLNLLN